MDRRRNLAAYYDCNAAAFKVQGGDRASVTRTTHSPSQ